MSTASISNKYIGNNVVFIEQTVAGWRATDEALLEITINASQEDIVNHPNFKPVLVKDRAGEFTCYIRKDVDLLTILPDHLQVAGKPLRNEISRPYVTFFKQVLGL